MPSIPRRELVAAFAVLAVAPQVFAAAPTLELWKMRTCPCCAGWAEHLAAAGFVTTVQEVDDVGAIRAADGSRSVFMEVRP
jgi:hypothetical protein